MVYKEEEFRSPKEAGVNRVFVRKPSLDNDVICETTSPLAESRHYI